MTATASALVLGLLSALFWGAANFLIRVGGRTLGIHRSMLYAQGTSFLCVALWIASDRELRETLGGMSLATAATVLGASSIGLLATWALYRGLATGRVGLVAPIAGAYGAVTAGFSAAFGEPLGSVQLAGIAMVIAGGALVSAPSAKAHLERSGKTGAALAGLLWALLCCIGYGVQFWLFGRYAVPRLGALVPVGIYYALTTVVLGVSALIARPPLSLSPRGAVVVLGTGALALAGFGTLSAGLATGSVALVTALGSLQSAVAAGLAVVLLRERVAAHQWLGVGAILTGLALVRA
jgi:drug/metabolite transporter (DMT)-like permease